MAIVTQTCSFVFSVIEVGTGAVLLPSETKEYEITYSDMEDTDVLNNILSSANSLFIKELRDRYHNDTSYGWLKQVSWDISSQLLG